MGTGSSIPFNDKIQVVIIGGGFGGCYLTNQLKNYCKVTLIDPNDAMFLNVPAVRAIVDIKFHRPLFIPYESFCKDQFKKGKLVGIDKERNVAKLEDGSEVEYTHLVLATGSSSSFPAKLYDEYPGISMEEGIKRYEEVFNELEKSKRVVVVGGGAVGVEIISEIATDYPDKEVTLIHSSNVLVSPRLVAKAQNAIKTNLDSMKVKLITSDKVTNLSEIAWNKQVNQQVVKTESGKEIVCDFAIPCLGVTNSTKIYADSLPDSINDAGQVKVDQFLKVEGTNNIYAIGDITNIEEEKMAYRAKLHAEQLAKNFMAQSKNAKPKPYITTETMMVVSMGRNKGVGQMKGMVLGNFLSKKIKCTDLLAHTFWKDFGLKYPE